MTPEEEDAIDQLDFPTSSSNDVQDETKEAQNDFDDFTLSASAVTMSKETKHGSLVETKGTIAKHAHRDAAEAVEYSAVESFSPETATDATNAVSASVVENMAALSFQDAPLSSKDTRRFVTAKDFDLLKVIGMGAFGKVLQVRHKHTSRILAMKVISKRLLLRKSGYVENIQAERQILTRVRSPFVVTMHCSFQTREKLFIVMDFLAGGELFLRLGREGIFLEKTVRSISWESLVQSCRFIVSRHI